MKLSRSKPQAATGWPSESLRMVEKIRSVSNCLQKVSEKIDAVYGEGVVNGFSKEF